MKNHISIIVVCWQISHVLDVDVQYLVIEVIDSIYLVQCKT